MNPAVSAVIPVFNEEGNVLPLVTALADVLQQHAASFEIIVVNDGSTDGTAAEIAQAAERVPACRELRLARQSGQAAALLAGLRAARGSLIVTLDGDGQNDPRDLPALMAMVTSGQVDLACGWRQGRQGSRLRATMSRLANGVRRRVLRDGVHDSGCQLRAFRREVIAALHPMELMQSFVPALASAAGFRVGERPVRDHPRTAGTSKYGFLRLWLRPALAMVQLRWQWWRRPPVRHVVPPSP